MTGQRTTTVRTLDHGNVTITEPAWCLGHHEHGLHLQDLIHEGPEVGLMVQGEQSHAPVLPAALVQHPFHPDQFRRLPAASVLIGDGWTEMGPDELRHLAVGLVAHADRLRDLADELELLFADSSALETFDLDASAGTVAERPVPSPDLEGLPEARLAEIEAGLQDEFRDFTWSDAVIEELLAEVRRLRRA